MIITKTNILCMYILNEIQLIHFKKVKYPIFLKKNSKQKQDKILNFCQTQNVYFFSNQKQDKLFKIILILFSQKNNKNLN